MTSVFPENYSKLDRSELCIEVTRLRTRIRRLETGLQECADAGCGCGDECPCAVSVTGECCGECASGIAKALLAEGEKGD